ncbi:MAG: thiol-disulfide oxidoreductase [Candidatus Eremiobacter antarcticus]|nr:TlpA family protein disulfide reductase [Candidatus Eremiobacteraeota bacterium]MBC5808566.1 TlpA family protein disulfide reductase [Candidatus Eremiobacteraeota bacterium]PZR61166.1 MAG: thiol-disulfide oxidoreductase [Candidatus Eremiobacter sp. RRmetagenome_bin22]
MSKRFSGVVAGLIVLVLFTIAGLLLWTDVNVFRETSTHSPIEKKAPDVSLISMSGKPVRLSSFEGRPLWLNFFATWCTPCKAEMPDVEKQYRRLHKRGLVVLGIDQQETAALVADFSRRFDLSFPRVIDAGKAAEAYGVHAIPTSVFIDRAGIVRAVHIGALSSAQMDAELAKIMGTTGSS